VADANELSDEDRGDLTANVLWKNLPPAARADIAAHMTPEQKSVVRKGIRNAENILDNQRRQRG
jgi:hypothetical protein